MHKWTLIGDFLRTYKLRSSVVIGASLLGGLLSVVIPVSIGLYYDLVFNFSTHRSRVFSLLPEAWTATVPAFLVFLSVLVALRLCLMFVERYHSGILGEHFSQSLREKMFLHQTRAHMSHYDEKGTGRYLLRYSVDLKSIQDFLTVGLFQFVGDVFLLLLAFSAMAVMNMTIAMIALGGVLISTAVIHVLNRRLHRVSKKRRNARSRLVSFVSQQLLGMLAIKMLNREVVEVKRFTRLSLKLLRAGRAFQLVQAAITSLIPAMSYFVLIGILWYVFDVSSREDRNVPRDGLIGFVLLFITILPILRRTFHVESIWKMGSISFRKLIRVFEQSTETPRGDKKTAITGDIVFDAVTFSYGDKVIFSDLSFRVPWRETSLMLIRPGMGRTTILKILTRVYAQHAGAVRYGEIDSDVDPWNIRRAIAIVSESLPLLGKTVFEAISYGRQSGRKKEAVALLDRIQQGETRDVVRMNIDAPIGELGRALSTAQKMQLMYARALLSDKPYLFIEDDFLWADKNMKKNIARILEEMRGKKTILWMASNRAPIPVEFDGTVRATMAER